VKWQQQQQQYLLEFLSAVPRALLHLSGRHEHVAYQAQSGSEIMEAKMFSKSKNESTWKNVPKHIHGNASCMVSLNLLASVLTTVPQILT
jgi:hypothetical protein